MNTRSIGFRLVTWYAGLLTGIFLLLCALLYLNLRHFLENDLRESQARRARQIAQTLLVHVGQTGEAYVASQTKDWYEPEINDRFIRITRADGTLVYVSGAPKDGSFDPAEVPIFPPSLKTEFSHKLKLSGGNTLLVAALNFKSSGNPDYLVEFGALLDPVEINAQPPVFATRPGFAAGGHHHYRRRLSAGAAGLDAGRTNHARRRANHAVQFKRTFAGLKHRR